jgi:hypothetical protein
LSIEPENTNSEAPNQMLRNPFKKDDSGCSFLCFIFAGLLIQVTYFFIYIETAYLKDHNVTLLYLAKKRGYDDLSDLPYNDPLIQEGDIVINEKLWIPAAIFYFFSILWFTSYFRLVFTDIKVKASDD